MSNVNQVDVLEWLHSTGIEPQEFSDDEFLKRVKEHFKNVWESILVDGVRSFQDDMPRENS